MKKINDDWILVGINENAIEWSRELARELATKGGDLTPMSTSQLRKFYGGLKRIQSNFELNKQEICLLKPKLAYSVGKSIKITKNEKIQTSKIVTFYNSVESGLTLLSKNLEKEQFNRFVALVESIVAFHKYHGGE